MKAAPPFTTGNACVWMWSLMEIGIALSAFVQPVPIRTSGLASSWYFALLQEVQGLTELLLKASWGYCCSMRPVVACNWEEGATV